MTTDPVAGETGQQGREPGVALEPGHAGGGESSDRGHESDRMEPTPESWGPLTKDFLAFEGKLVVDGFLDVVMAPVVAVMFFLDLITGDRSGRRFHWMLRRGRRFEQWLRLYRPLSRVGRPKDKLTDAGLAGADQLVAKIEGMVREQELPEAYRERLRAIADRARALKPSREKDGGDG